MKKSDTKQLVVKGLPITTRQAKAGDFISLTDMAKFKSYDSGVVIANWLSTKYTIQFIGAWEQLHNPNFNLIEFHKIKNEAGSHGYIVSSSLWINNTGAIGLVSKPGRYGGTYAHQDIAVDMEAHTLTRILLLNLPLGYLQNLNCISSRNSNDSKRKKSNASSWVGI